MRDHTIPFDLQKTCCDWFDGKGSAMWAAYLGNPFSARKLLAETMKCLRNLHLKKEQARLEAVRDWAKHEMKRERAYTGITRAVAQAMDTGLETWEIAETFERALRQETARRHAK